MDQRPAPVVTISDPTRPGEPVDVMESGSEKEPWRPTRKHWTALGVLVLLALAAVVPDKVVAARAADRRAELAAVEGVRLSFSPGAEGAQDEHVQAVLSNDGPDPVTLVQVQVDGYQPIRLDKKLKLSSGTTLDLADTAACSERLLAPGSETRAAVRVRTAGGTVVTRRVPVQSEIWLPLNLLAQRRCGFPSVSDTLRLTAVGHPNGGGYEVRITARNTGRLPIEFGYVDAGAGFDANVQGDQPVRIAPGQTRRLDYVIHLNNGCGDARGSNVSVDGDLQLTVNANTLLSDGSYANDAKGLVLLGSEGSDFKRWFDGQCPA